MILVYDYMAQDKLPAGQKPKFTGVVSGLTYTVRTTGFFSLYRGLTPTLLGSMPKAGIRFGANAELKKVMHSCRDYLEVYAYN